MVEAKRGGRLAPFATAMLAVVAAIVTLVSNKSASDALGAKNNAILVRAEASDEYNVYEAHGIKENVYEAVEAATPGRARGTLAAVAARERIAKEPPLAKAREDERRAADLTLRSQRLNRAHEILDVAVAFFEVAIAIVSVAALATSTWLLRFGLAIGAGGLLAFLFGLSAR